MVNMNGKIEIADLTTMLRNKIIEAVCYGNEIALVKIEKIDGCICSAVDMQIKVAQDDAWYRIVVRPHDVAGLFE